MFKVFALLLLCISLTLAQEIDPNLKCGDTNTKGQQYKSWDNVYLCLVFPEMNSGGNPRKVVFHPRMDRFEVLQI